VATVEDILVIAPYNLQVGRIRERLPGIRVASVDKFQGQEAPVVIYSMAASSGNDCPRGIDFLFSRNRTNVAISRAKSLAIVVGSPDRCRTSCSSIDQMRLVNLYCRIVHAGCPDQASEPIS
jgi:superfamily I DNA and/or RNA helicase